MESIVVNHLIYEEQVREKFGGEGQSETSLLSTIDYWESVKKKEPDSSQRCTVVR